VPTIEKDTYIIIETRDIRYQPLPMISVDSQTPPKLIANYDKYMMKFKFKHFSHGQLREASNSMRPFMSRYGRVIEFKGTGVLTIQESAAHLLRSYELIKSFDRELTAEEIKDQKEREAEYKEEKKAERKEKYMHKEEEVKEVNKK
jgi:general secretion pathway protein D